MVSANAALVLHDVVPAWTADEPPSADAALTPGQSRSVQLDIYDAQGRLIGQSWTVARLAVSILTVQNWTLLESITLPNGVRTPPARIDSELAYNDSRVVDRLSMRIIGLGLPAGLTGEFIPPDTFPCVWQMGELRGRFLLPAAATRALGDVIRPFDRLPGLYVGRSWRVKLVNPLAQIVPGMGSAAIGVDSMLVTVVGRDSIEHNGVTVNCYRVETRRATAWVAADGRVLKQTVELPLLGTLTLLDRPFDEDARQRALIRFRGG
ncbi:MAG: hypothetical protein CHACPFDD_01802 [Phycisphaerae bacterium]|nr:hypothetical protein [Phycisphaerae bacterium]